MTAAFLLVGIFVVEEVASSVPDDVGKIDMIDVDMDEYLFDREKRHDEEE